MNLVQIGRSLRRLSFGFQLFNRFRSHINPSEFVSSGTKRIFWEATLISICFLSLSVGSAAAQSITKWGKLQSDSYKSLQDNFNNPDLIYAPFLYWFWDEPLDREKIRTMTHGMLKQGFNPGYIFAHTSMADLLATTPGLEKAMDPHPSLPDKEWLSQEWFDAIKDVCDIAKEKNAYVTYADEYMWPSGRANGRVIKQHPELNNSNLGFSVTDVAGGEKVNLPESFFTVAAKKPETEVRDEFVYASSREIFTPSGLVVEDMYGRKSIGQTITVEKPWLKEVSIMTTCWFGETKRGFTLEARINSIDGRLVSQKYYEPGLHEYDRPGLEIPEVFPGGTRLYIGVIPDNGLVAGELGWWGKKGDVYPGGEAWLNGESQAQNGLDCYVNLYYKAREANESPDPGTRNLREGRSPYFETKILSSGLRLIGEGNSFTWTAPKGNSWRVYTFTKKDGGSVNYLDERLAPAFIEIAHKPYFEKLGNYMSSVIPGAICDNEGGFGPLPWSVQLPTRYKKATGNDIRLMMPLLIDKDVEGKFAKARFDFMETVSDLYSSYFGEVSDYLQKHDMYYISNFWEESLQWISSGVGDLMKMQRRFSMPGTDALTLKIFDPHDLAESHSVAAFEGRRFECEFMGAGGWGDLTMKNLKAGINATTTWGANHIVLHALFMARNQKGNVWVPDYYDELPLWQYMHVWSDFVRRTSYINSQGNVVPDVLLLNPLSSAWVLLGNPEEIWGPPSGNVNLLDNLYDKKVQKINHVYSDAIREMYKYRIEYLIADGYYMNRMQLNGKELSYGDFRFKTVVMPPMVVLPLAVAEKLVGFAEAGGTIYSLGELPTGSTDNGMNDRKMLKLMKQLKSQPGFKLLEGGIVAEMKDPSSQLQSQINFISGGFEMLQKHRFADGRHFFWLANNGDETRNCEVEILKIQGLASIWDCETGKISEISSDKKGNNSRVRLSFRPNEAYWLVIDPEKPMKPAFSIPVKAENEKIILTLDGDWNISIDPDVQPNLEFPVKVSNNLIVNGLKRNLSLWDKWEEVPNNFSGLLDYTKTFNLDEAPGEATIDLGKVYHFAQVSVNGEDLGTKLWPPHNFTTIALKKGTNIIHIRVGNLVNNNYDMKPGIDSFGRQLTEFMTWSGLIGPVRLIVK